MAKPFEQNQTGSVVQDIEEIKDNLLIIAELKEVAELPNHEPQDIVQERHTVLSHKVNDLSQKLIDNHHLI